MTLARPYANEYLWLSEAQSLTLGRNTVTGAVTIKVRRKPTEARYSRARLLVNSGVQRL
jgi:hypothetical protein